MKNPAAILNSANGGEILSTLNIHHNAMSLNGACRKCHTEIPLSAERCKACGFEPKVGLFGWLIAWIALMMGFTFIMFSLASIAVMFDGYRVTYGLLFTAIFGLLGVGLFNHALDKWRLHRQTPAMPLDELVNEEGVTTSDPLKSHLAQSYSKGEELGEQWRTRFDKYPSWAFSMFIFAGTVLIVTVFVIAGAEVEIAGIPTADLVAFLLIVTVIILPLTILGDIGRVNRVYDANHKWWAWTLPAAIPVIGLIPALGWLWRRRSTTRTSNDKK